MTSFPPLSRRISALSRGILACLALALFSAALLVAQSIAQSAPPSSQAQDASSAQSATPAQSTPTPAAAAGQEEPTLVIRQTVRRVIVDVMVRDSNGKPVHGLTADDFSISEDKKPQRTLSFDVYDFDKPSISRGPNAPPLPPNVFVNVPAAPERGPLYVILYDMVNTQTEDQMTGRQQVLKFINGKPEGTRFAIFVNSDELALAQGFTDDKNQLHAALDGKTHRRHVPNIFLYGANYGRGNPLVIVAGAQLEAVLIVKQAAVLGMAVDLLLAAATVIAVEPGDRHPQQFVSAESAKANRQRIDGQDGVGVGIKQEKSVAGFFKEGLGQVVEIERDHAETILASSKRGQAPFAGTARRVLRTNGA